MQEIREANYDQAGNPEVAHAVCRDGSGKTWIAWFGKPFASREDAEFVTARRYQNGEGFPGPTDTAIPILKDGKWYWSEPDA